MNTDELSDVSDDELNQILFPYFNKPIPSSSSKEINERNDVTIQVTTKDMNKSNPNELNQILFPYFNKQIQPS